MSEADAIAAMGALVSSAGGACAVAPQEANTGARVNIESCRSWPLGTLMLVL
jgi:hypothetical protein